ncbi:hypothetical protein SUGI_1222570 [Cryptomeria japonica]|uniref:Uncharacterized protein n=1 Tax=Cryptomeria japonica TaxID=3369 RepID=A0AAD3NPT4_CRYJA|nr:hypothetical protein SUGI_1222570 [Cryptomeria japonica]
MIYALLRSWRGVRCLCAHQNLRTFQSRPPCLSVQGPCVAYDACCYFTRSMGVNHLYIASSCYLDLNQPTGSVRSPASAACSSDAAARAACVLGAPYIHAAYLTRASHELIE